MLPALKALASVRERERLAQAVAGSVAALLDYIGVDVDQSPDELERLGAPRTVVFAARDLAAFRAHAEKEGRT